SKVTQLFGGILAPGVRKVTELFGGILGGGGVVDVRVRFGRPFSHDGGARDHAGGGVHGTEGRGGRAPTHPEAWSRRVAARGEPLRDLRLRPAFPPGMGWSRRRDRGSRVL